MRYYAIGRGRFGVYVKAESPEPSYLQEATAGEVAFDERVMAADPEYREALARWKAGDDSTLETVVAWELEHDERADAPPYSGSVG